MTEDEAHSAFVVAHNTARYLRDRATGSHPLLAFDELVGEALVALCEASHGGAVLSENLSHTIAMRRCINHIRRVLGRTENYTTAPVRLATASYDELEDHHATALPEADFSLDLERVMAPLKEDDRTLLREYYVMQTPQIRLAVQRGVTEARINQRLREAREKAVAHATRSPCN
jgi:RNA polymerase sigma factor (sigma-70 family)